MLWFWIGFAAGAIVAAILSADIVAEQAARLSDIRALAVDRDGFATVESLGALVDEIAEIAERGDE